MSKILRSIQRCGVFIHDVDLRNFIASDIIEMVEVFHEWGTVGFIPCNPSGGWQESQHPMDFGSGYLQMTDTTSNSQIEPFAPQGRRGRIRGESLRCLYILLREHPDLLSGQLAWLLRDSKRRPGLASIVLFDTNAFARRFAMYIMIVPLRSDKVRRWVGQFSRCPRKGSLDESSLSRELFASLELTISSMKALLQGSREGDLSSACHVLSDFSTGIPWKSFNDKVEVIYPIVLSLIGHVKDAVNLRMCDKLIMTISNLVQHISLEKTDVTSLASAIVSKISYNSFERNAQALILSSNFLVARFPHKDCSESLQAIAMKGLSLVHALLEGSISLDRTAHVERCIASTLRNVSILGQSQCEQAVDSCIYIDGLLDLREETRDALYFGIGKYARNSLQITIKSMECGIGLSSSPTSSSIECVGDLYFSSVLFEVDNLTPTLYLNKLFDWVEQEPTRERSLRAVMTGVSRLRESESLDPRSKSVALLTEKITYSLLRMGSVPNCSINLQADLVRTVGLIQPLIIPDRVDPSFIVRIDDNLISALTSNKTQITLAAFYTLTEMNRIQRTVDFAVPYVLQAIDDAWKKLESHSIWDFASAAFIAGKLHVLYDGYRFLKGFDSSLLIGDRCDFQILQSVRLKSVSKYNANIAKYVAWLSENCVQCQD